MHFWFNQVHGFRPVSVRSGIALNLALPVVVITPRGDHWGCENLPSKVRSMGLLWIWSLRHLRTLNLKGTYRVYIVGYTRIPWLRSVLHTS